MTPYKRKKRNERKERLRVQKHTDLPRRPFKPSRPGASRRDRIDQILANLERDMMRAEEQMKREARWADALNQMRDFYQHVEAGRPVLCQEPDGRLTPLAELKARYPGYIDIALPPHDPSDPGPQVETEEITETNPPILQFAIDSAPGWRVALVPPSRIQFTKRPESSGEEIDAG